jgi:hypothetical protein
MAQPATRNLGRLSEIAQVAVRHGFGYWFDTHRLTDLFPRRTRVELDGQPSQRGQHLREMLDELELRVAQLEHRLRLLEGRPRPVGTRQLPGT